MTVCRASIALINDFDEKQNVADGRGRDVEAAISPPASSSTNKGRETTVNLGEMKSTAQEECRDLAHKTTAVINALNTHKYR